MEKYYLPSDVRKADENAASYGLPTVVLMENAAKAAAHLAVEMAGGTNGRFVILAGRGNNGGDGFAAARHLLILGVSSVTILKTAPDEKYGGDAATNLAVLRAFADPRVEILDTPNIYADEDIYALICGASCVMDGLLGTGTHGAPRGEAARIIKLLEGTGHILALDIPSGIDPESGVVYDPCVKAEATATFLVPKLGMAFEPAADVCGKIVTADIGMIPDKILPSRAALNVLDKSDLQAMLPRISRDIHKTMRGNLMIFGGSFEYRGAPLLAARGALRAGGGLVFAAVPDFIAPYMAQTLPEVIPLPLPTKDGEIDGEAAFSVISEWLPKCTAVAAGPGCGRGAGAEYIFEKLWNECHLPMLLDADMLWFFAKHKDSLTPRDNVILTPHSAEAGRILGLGAGEVNATRAKSAAALAEKTGFALLKGQRTLIASRDNSMMMINAGSPALAIPGSGDVLSGVVGAFIASGMAVDNAAAVGALAHAIAGEHLEERIGLRGSLAREIADEIPAVLRG